MNQTIEINTPDGTLTAYVARPAAKVAPAVIVLQEIFGVNEGIRSIADQLAEDGIVAVCPDLFWRTDPGLSMSESNPAHQQRGFALYNAYDMNLGIADISHTIARVRTLPFCSGSVGVMGFCLGGLLTYLAAAGTDADAGVSYYGGGTDRFLDRAPAIVCPLLMHLAGDDEYIGKDAQAAIQAALAHRPHVHIHTYPGRDHAFSRPGGQHYHAPDAHLAYGRTLAFMREHLAPATA